MMQRVRHLNVHRRLSNGSLVPVGQLAQNARGVFFQYDSAYLEQFHSLSPFSVPFDSALLKAPLHPHSGLHGLFSDSLPDGWGMLLMNRVFRQRGISSHEITAMDRLAYIGGRGTGALEYIPAMGYEEASRLVELGKLGEQAAQLFEGQTEEVLGALANVGGSAGARPKALIWLDSGSSKQASTVWSSERQAPWLVKFTSGNLPLGHDEGRCEASWLSMAEACGIDVPQWRLFSQANGRCWLGMKRFDCVHGLPQGRIHMHSLCGLLDANFREPSMDYEDLIKASQVLCQSPAVGKIQFKRAMFNLFSVNQDDHTRNWSFLMSDSGQWQPSPFYDITFSPTPFNEHSLSFGGYGSHPPLRVVQKLASLANYRSWKEARADLESICEALSRWEALAADLDVSSGHIKGIRKKLDAVYQANKRLLGK